MAADTIRLPPHVARVAALTRQSAVVEDLVARACDPLGWLAVRRQAGSYLRNLEPLLMSPTAPPLASELTRHQAELLDWHSRAETALRTADPDEVRQAMARLGIRLAVVGKGGAGKTLITSTLTRLLARRGRRVLAADLDTNPGLAFSIGLAGIGTGDVDPGFPSGLVEEDEGSAYGWRMVTGVTPRQAVEQFATVGPDGVRILTLGKIAGVDKIGPKQSVVALVQLLLGFGEPEWDVIADLEAGPTTPFERYHAFADDVAVVVGPAWRSAMTARRLLPMVGDRNPLIVGNRYHGEPDHPGLTPRVRIPFDPSVAEAERQGLSPLDVCPNSPAIEAIGRLADLLVTDLKEVPV